MVRAPEKFLDEYLSHEKDLKGNPSKKSSRIQRRKVSEGEFARLKQNLKTVWGIYSTPEIKEILSKKQRIRFLDIEGASVSLNLSYVDKGILMEYELDMGDKKELAGARVYKQAEVNISRYFNSEAGAEGLLKTTDTALKVLVEALIDEEILEANIWNVIAQGEQIHISNVVSL